LDPQKMPRRVVEAYVGEYASGKSEVAVNRAIALARGSRVGSRCGGEPADIPVEKLQRVPVTLVDFDLVEPFYTLRPIKKLIEKEGVTVLAWQTEETMGFGETGTLMRSDLRWALRREGHVIFDMGYGIDGARRLNLIEGARENNLQVYAVINIGRPMTACEKDIVTYVKTLGPIDGLINNSHLGDETDVDFIQKGAIEVAAAAAALRVPFLFTTADQRFQKELGFRDATGNPVFYLKRYMNRAYW